MAFDISPTLVSDRLKLRPLMQADRPALYEAASNPETWAQHPAHDRHKKDVFDPYFDFLVDASGTLAAIERKEDRVIGCSRFYEVPDQPGEFGIGFTFLACSHWGGSWNKEMKELMLSHALKTFPRVWFHIAPNNLRSQIAATRLGAQFAYDAELLIGQSASVNKCYTLTSDDWQSATGKALPL